MNIAIIGAGNIGSEVYRKAIELGWNIKFLVKQEGIYKDLNKKIDDIENYPKYCEDLDVVFLAIPTFDDGKTAFSYMSKLLEKGIPIVTCEKGSLSNYFNELEKHIDKIGFSATVGGGTRLLRYVKERINNNIKEIHAVVNGTLNFIFDEVSKGNSLNQAVEQAQKRGFAEPGANNSLEVINKEAIGDVPMKASILFNMCNLSEKRIKAKDIKTNEITEDELNKLIQAKTMRYVVSITKEPQEKVGGFTVKVDDWVISAGFKDIEKNKLLKQLVPSGVNNAILLNLGKDGNYSLIGPGAGSGPTASSMINDAIKLLE